MRSGVPGLIGETALVTKATRATAICRIALGTAIWSVTGITRITFFLGMKTAATWRAASDKLAFYATRS